MSILNLLPPNTEKNTHQHLFTSAVLGSASTCHNPPTKPTAFIVHSVKYCTEEFLHVPLFFIKYLPDGLHTDQGKLKEQAQVCKTHAVFNMLLTTPVGQSKNSHFIVHSSSWIYISLIRRKMPLSYSSTVLHHTSQVFFGCWSFVCLFVCFLAN